MFSVCRPSHALEFEFVEFFGLKLSYPGEIRDDFLTLGDFNINGLIGVRPIFVFNNHLSLEPSLGFGFPSLFGLFTADNVTDIPGILFFDVVYHFHFPGLYPYVLAGLGYWWHYIVAPSNTTSSGVTPGGQLLMRSAFNLGMGLSFLAGFKIGMTYSVEGAFGSNQHVHLMLDIDYALF